MTRCRYCRFWGPEEAPIAEYRLCHGSARELEEPTADDLDRKIYRELARVLEIYTPADDNCERFQPAGGLVFAPRAGSA